MRFGRRRRESEFDRGYRDGLDRGRPDPSQGMSIGEPYEDGFAAGAHTFERLAERARHLLAAGGEPVQEPDRYGFRSDGMHLMLKAGPWVHYEDWCKAVGKRPAYDPDEQSAWTERPRRVLIVEAPGDEFAVGEAFKLGDVVQGSMSQVADADEVFVFRGDKAIAAKHRDREPEDVTVSIQRQIRPRPAAADEPENPTEFTRQVLESAKALVKAATFDLLALDRGNPVSRVQVEEAIERAFRGLDSLPLLDRIDAAYRRFPVEVPPGEVVIRMDVDQAEALVDPSIMRIGSEREVERARRREAALAQIALAVESAR